MTRLVVADAHLGQRSGDAAEMVALLERAAGSGVGEVVFLGDPFQYLIGMSKFWTATVREVMACWQRLRADRTRVVLVEGNRDFFLDGVELACQVDWSGRQYEFLAGSRRYRLTHGDLVNRRDLQYRLWARVSKSGLARVWAKLLPRPVAVCIIRSMEARLTRTNRRYRTIRPVAALRRAAGAAWGDGVDVMLWGHFHLFWRHEQGGRLAMVVPAWLDDQVSLLVEPDGAWSFVDSALTPTGSIPRMGATADGAG